jgi:multiphosphoryl transfer protein
MVGLVLVSHSRSLAEAAVDLLRHVVIADIPLSCSGGAGDSHGELGTDALDIQKAISAVYSEDGVLVFMDSGSAIMSAELAKEFLSPEQQKNVRLTSAPLVEGGIAAAVQAQAGASLEEVTKAALQSLFPKQDQIQDAEPAAGEGRHAPDLPINEVLDVTIQNEHGLHLRPAALLIKTLAGFPAKVLIENRTGRCGPVLARSLVDVTRLQIHKSDSVRFSISAANPKPVIDAIRSLVDTRFGEASESIDSDAVEDAADAIQPFGISGGTAVGRPFLLDAIPVTIPSYTVESAPDIAREVGKLRSAIAAAIADFDKQAKRLTGTLSRNELDIFDAQRMIFEDPTVFQEVRKKIERGHMNAAAAWHDALSRYATDQEKVDDSYLRARAADFREAERAVQRHLDGDTKGALPQAAFTEPTLIVCEELTPLLAEQFYQLSVAGVIQLAGGATSHGAILARALGLPSIGGAKNYLEQLRSARQVAISGTDGQLWIDPAPDVLGDVTERQQIERIELERAIQESAKDAVTTDGDLVEVGANASTAADVSSARINGAKFVGLFRSEFLFQNFNEEPDEGQQLAAYHDALTPCAGSMPVTLRLLDAGGDKPLKFLQPPKEANPFLGIRGIRLLIANPRFMRSHLRAVLRLAYEFPIRLLMPMVTDVSEILVTRKMLAEAAVQLAKDRQPHRWPMAIGAMIETPSAGLLIKRLLPHLDFVSIGTNDLTQYTLCAERGNPSLLRFSDSLHPAVLLICEQVIRESQTHGVKVSICGESASDPEALPIWLGLGLRELSVTVAAVPAIKALVRRFDASDIMARINARLFALEGAAEVRQFSRSLTRIIQPSSLTKAWKSHEGFGS